MAVAIRNMGIFQVQNFNFLIVDSSIGFSLGKNYMLLIVLHFISMGDFFIKTN